MLKTTQLIIIISLTFLPLNLPPPAHQATWAFSYSNKNYWAGGGGGGGDGDEKDDSDRLDYFIVTTLTYLQIRKLRLREFKQFA